MKAGTVYALLAALIWGLAFVAQSVGAEYVPPFLFNAARGVIAFLFLSVLCVLRRIATGREGRAWAEKKRGTSGQSKAEARKELALAALCCGTALAVSSCLQQKGLETTAAGKAGFITALYIVIVPVLSIALKKNPPVTVWVSVVLAAAGLWLLCVTGELTIEPGDLYVLLCALGFSVQILTIDHFSTRVDGVELSCFQFLVVAVLSFLGAAVSGESVTLSNLTAALRPLLYTGIMSSGVAYTFQILAQRDSNPTVVSLVLSLESVFATLSGAVILHERLTGREYLGCALMLSAVVLAQLPGKADKRTA